VEGNILHLKRKLTSNNKNIKKTGSNSESTNSEISQESYDDIDDIHLEAHIEIKDELEVTFDSFLGGTEMNGPQNVQNLNSDCSDNHTPTPDIQIAQNHTPEIFFQHNTEILSAAQKE
jgi:hypothetical protein